MEQETTAHLPTGILIKRGPGSDGRRCFGLIDGVGGGMCTNDDVGASKKNEMRTNIALGKFFHKHSEQFYNKRKTYLELFYPG